MARRVAVDCPVEQGKVADRMCVVGGIRMAQMSFGLKGFLTNELFLVAPTNLVRKKP